MTIVDVLTALVDELSALPGIRCGQLLTSHTYSGFSFGFVDAVVGSSTTIGSVRADGDGVTVEDNWDSENDVRFHLGDSDFIDNVTGAVTALKAMYCESP